MYAFYWIEKKTGEVTHIIKTEWWEDRYIMLSGKPFPWAKEAPIDEKEKPNDTANLVLLYEELSGKKVSIRYKNDQERLAKKVAELSL